LRYLIGRGPAPTPRTDADAAIAWSELGIYAGADAFDFAAARGSVESVRLLFEHA
jgi:hypothetical protein